MESSININHILSQVKKLDETDQLLLLRRMIALIQRKDNKSSGSMRLVTLSGLGREIWKNVDEINKYIDEERQW